MSLDSEVELIRRLPIFAKIELPMLKLLCFSSERLNFGPGQVIVNAGDVADAAYMLIDGYVEITRPTPAGPLVVGTLGPMEIVGDMAIFAEMPRTATVTATTRVDALRIAKEQFTSIIRANPDAALELIRILVMRLNNTTARLTESMSTSTPNPGATPAAPGSGQATAGKR